MKCSFGISDFLEEIPSLSHSLVFLYFLALNTEVGCHVLLQCTNGKSESEVAQSCPTLLDPMDCSPPGSCVGGGLFLESVAIAFSGTKV